MNVKSVSIVVLVLALVGSLYLNFMAYTARNTHKQITFEDAVMTATYFHSLDTAEKRRAFSLQLVGNNESIFNTASADDCDMWLRYADYYMDKMVDIVDDYEIPDFKWSVYSMDVPEPTFALFETGGYIGSMADMDFSWGIDSSDQEMKDRWLEAINEESKGMLLAYKQAYLAMLENARVACQAKADSGRL